MSDHAAAQHDHVLTGRVAQRGRIGRYALWQLRDYAISRGVPTLIIGALFLLQIRALGTGLASRLPPATLLRLLSELLGPFVLIAALVAINGIISNDRKQGHFRFLFAKPVSITRYYLQAFALHGVGVLVATALFLLAVRWMSGVTAPLATLLYPVAYYALLGGIGFFFSSLLRNDWIPLAAVLALSALAFFRWGNAPGLAGWVVRWVLPPFHMFDELRNELLMGTVPGAWPELWPVIYGILALAAGVVVLRRKAMG